MAYILENGVVSPCSISDFLTWSSCNDQLMFRTDVLGITVQTFFSGFDLSLNPDAPLVFETVAVRKAALDEPAESLRELGVIIGQLQSSYVGEVRYSSSVKDAEDAHTQACSDVVSAQVEGLKLEP